MPFMVSHSRLSFPLSKTQRRHVLIDGGCIVAQDLLNPLKVDSLLCYLSAWSYLKDEGGLLMSGQVVRLDAKDERPRESACQVMQLHP